MRVDIGAYRVQMAAISCFQGTLFDKNSFKTNYSVLQIMQILLTYTHRLYTTKLECG